MEDLTLFEAARTMGRVTAAATAVLLGGAHLADHGAMAARYAHAGVPAAGAAATFAGVLLLTGGAIAYVGRRRRHEITDVVVSPPRAAARPRRARPAAAGEHAVLAEAA
jgi:hypothetical protein